MWCRLWYHELSRVFCDRLINKADKAWGGGFTNERHRTESIESRSGSIRPPQSS